MKAKRPRISLTERLRQEAADKGWGKVLTPAEDAEFYCKMEKIFSKRSK